MMLERVLPGATGFEHRLFECPKCDHVEIKVVSSDPFTSSKAAGWLAGELRAPNWRQRHARQTKPRSAMHRLRFSDEAGGNW